MPNKNYVRERVLLVNSRLSFPSLAEPKPGFNGGKAKFQANFLFPAGSPAHQAIDAAVRKVAQDAFPTSWQAVLASSEKNPIHSGDLKPDTAGYPGNLYICAKSDNRPLLKDADRTTIVTEQDIKTKFVAGYTVNAFVDVYPYWFRGPTGAVIRSGVGLGLVAVQFAGYGEPFGGSTPPADDAFPDATAQVAATSAEGFAQVASAVPPASAGYSPVPAAQQAPYAANGYAPGAAAVPPASAGYGPGPAAQQAPYDDVPF